jgi:hypothetical protein
LIEGDQMEVCELLVKGVYQFFALPIDEVYALRK